MNAKNMRKKIKRFFSGIVAKFRGEDLKLLPEAIEEELIEELKLKAVKLKVTDSDLIARYIEEGLKRDDLTV